MNVFLITYLKNNDEIITRLVRHINVEASVGDINSYGWVVLDIQVFYNNQFITLDHYRSIREYKTKERIKKQRIKDRNQSLIEIIHNVFN